ncbi:MAG: hypothetical protein EA353_14705, partial [Puniceicoccaceae bacterium]
MSFFATTTPTFADTTSEKIRLMADALRARDSGDLQTAQQNAEALVRLAPDNENAQRLLASINSEIERRDGGSAVFGRASEADLARATAPSTATTRESGVLAGAEAQQAEKISAARRAASDARKLADLGAYDDANALISEARGNLDVNVATAPVLNELDSAAAYVLLSNARQLASEGRSAEANELLANYRQAGGDAATASRVTQGMIQELRNPRNYDIAEVSPAYVESQQQIAELIGRGRHQFLQGDYEGAIRTFQDVEARDPNNAEAKLFQERLAAIITTVHEQNRYKTRQQMLAEVNQAWDRPKVFDVERTRLDDDVRDQTILEKLRTITIPRVNFQGMELTRVIETLSELSVDRDPDGVGVNMIPLFDANTNNPRVNINVRNLSLDEILTFITQQVNFAYDVGSSAVTITPTDQRGERADLVTDFFPITRATVIRLTGVRGGGGGSGGRASSDPFAVATPEPRGGGASQSDEVEQLQRFFQSAGVNFEISGASLAFDGEQLIVTQTTRNLDRMRTILRNYDETKQVEIEAKFLEVAQNDLEELGFDWMVGGNNAMFNTQSRNLTEAFSLSERGSQIRITSADTPAVGDPNDPFSTPASAGLNERVDFFPPQIPGVLDLGTGAGAIANIGWNLGRYPVDVAIRALSRKTGSDLMSAPKVTVLSGKRATITVAQELRYPESYGDIDSQVSQASGGSIGGGGGNASVTITAGTPRDFTVRNVGVEMAVTPNVENN